jgi:hypothetical protein
MSVRSQFEAEFDLDSDVVEILLAIVTDFPQTGRSRVTEPGRTGRDGSSR